MSVKIKRVSMILIVASRTKTNPNPNVLPNVFEFITYPYLFLTTVPNITDTTIAPITFAITIPFIPNKKKPTTDNIKLIEFPNKASYKKYDFLSPFANMI